METPYFLIDFNKLEKNICDFKKALNKLWPNNILSYSIKTNSLPWLLEYLSEQNIYAEVVSDTEYKLSELAGFATKNIIFNGPIKGSNEF